jgi:hypothetical protein
MIVTVKSLLTLILKVHSNSHGKRVILLSILFNPILSILYLQMAKYYSFCTVAAKIATLFALKEFCTYQLVWIIQGGFTKGERTSSLLYI